MTSITTQIYMKRSNSYVHHFNYCQWRIPREKGEGGRVFKTNVS